MTITVTSVAHGLSSGNVVSLDDIVWTLDSGGAQPDQLNGQTVVVTVLDVDTFTIDGEFQQVARKYFNASGDTLGDDGRDFTWSPNGQTLIVFGGDFVTFEPVFFEYPVSTAFDVTTVGALANREEYFEQTETNVFNSLFAPSGLTVIVEEESSGGASVILHQYSLTAPFDISTINGGFGNEIASKVLSADLPGSQGVSGLLWNNDGTKLFVGGSSGDILEYALSTPYALSTIGSLVATVDISATLASPLAIGWSVDGTKFFAGTTSIFQFPASSAFDLSTVGASEGEINLVADDRLSTDRILGRITWLEDCRTFFTLTRHRSPDFFGGVEQWALSDCMTDCTIAPCTIDTTGWTGYVSGGVANEQIDSLGGLDHLEGETVGGLDNGIPFTGKTVSSGSIILQSSKAQVGFPFTHRFQSLKQDAGAPSGSALGKIKRIGNMTTALLWAASFTYGDDFFDTMFASDNENTNVFTGERYLEMDSGWGSDERFVFKGSEPLPWFCLAVMPELWVNDLK